MNHLYLDCSLDGSDRRLVVADYDILKRGPGECCAMYRMEDTSSPDGVLEIMTTMWDVVVKPVGSMAEGQSLDLARRKLWPACYAWSPDGRSIAAAGPAIYILKLRICDKPCPRAEKRGKIRYGEFGDP